MSINNNPQHQQPQQSSSQQPPQQPQQQQPHYFSHHLHHHLYQQSAQQQRLPSPQMSGRFYGQYSHPTAAVPATTSTAINPVNIINASPSTGAAATSASPSSLLFPQTAAAASSYQSLAASQQMHTYQAQQQQHYVIGSNPLLHHSASAPSAIHMVNPQSSRNYRNHLPPQTPPSPQSMQPHHQNAYHKDGSSSSMLQAQSKPSMMALTPIVPQKRKHELPENYEVIDPSLSKRIKGDSADPTEAQTVALTGSEGDTSGMELEQQHLVQSRMNSAIFELSRLSISKEIDDKIALSKKGMDGNAGSAAASIAIRPNFMTLQSCEAARLSVDFFHPKMLSEEFRSELRKDLLEDPNCFQRITSSDASLPKKRFFCLVDEFDRILKYLKYEKSTTNPTNKQTNQQQQQSLISTAASKKKMKPTQLKTSAATAARRSAGKKSEQTRTLSRNRRNLRKVAPKNKLRKNVICDDDEDDDEVKDHDENEQVEQYFDDDDDDGDDDEDPEQDHKENHQIEEEDNEDDDDDEDEDDNDEDDNDEEEEEDDEEVSDAIESSDESEEESRSEDDYRGSTNNHRSFSSISAGKRVLLRNKKGKSNRLIDDDDDDDQEINNNSDHNDDRIYEEGLSGDNNALHNNHHGDVSESAMQVESSSGIAAPTRRLGRVLTRNKSLSNEDISLDLKRKVPLGAARKSTTRNRLQINDEDDTISSVSVSHTKTTTAAESTRTEQQSTNEQFLVPAEQSHEKVGKTSASKSSSQLQPQPLLASSASVKPGTLAAAAAAVATGTAGQKNKPLSMTMENRMAKYKEKEAAMFARIHEFEKRAKIVFDNQNKINTITHSFSLALLEQKHAATTLEIVNDLLSLN